MGISVKLQVFEGPLDLLLHLIDKNKVNIYDIPIAMITEQYMEYVEQLKKEDLNVVSEFLVMAATLLDIKSRMLLQMQREPIIRSRVFRRQLQHIHRRLILQRLLVIQHLCVLTEYLLMFVNVRKIR